MSWYRWETWPEVVRLVAIAALTYLVQILPTVVDDVSTAANPWKVVIALVVAGLQFVGARVLAWVSEDRTPSRFD